MASCEVCGNDYRLSFEVHAAGAVHTFDSFECAIHAMAPVCEHCGVKVVGHGVEADGSSSAVPPARACTAARPASASWSTTRAGPRTSADREPRDLRTGGDQRLIATSSQSSSRQRAAFPL